MSLRTVLWNIFIFLFLVSSAGCTAANPSAAKITPITVQLAWTNQSQFAGLYAADQLGYFADEGLRVTFLEGGANYDKFAPVLTGAAQFGVGSADELILARSQDKPLKAIATIYRYNPIEFISLADKNITKPQDFIGKTIRAPANIAPTLNAMMARLGIGRDQYAYQDAPSDIQMFASGELPVWGVFRNAIAVSIQDAGYKLNIIYPDDYGVHFYADSLFTTDQLIASDPDLVLRFLRAALKGWTYAIENSQEVPAMVKKYNPAADLALEKERMIATIPLVNTGEDFIGWMKPQIWIDMEQTFREQGLEAKPVDVTQVYTMQFLEEIYK